MKPEVKPLNFSLNKDISNQKTIRLRIYDETSGIKSYNALINDKWALFEYEPKSNLIFHQIQDGIIKNGENNINIKVIDGVGIKKSIQKYTGLISFTTCSINERSNSAKVLA